MTRYCVDISHLDDNALSFFGYELVEENDEFKVYTDARGDDHIVFKAAPRLYVEDVNDVIHMSPSSVVSLSEDVDGV